MNYPPRSVANSTREGSDSDTGIVGTIRISINKLYSEDGRITPSDFLSTWRDIADEHHKDLDIPSDINGEAARRKLESNRFFFIAKRVIKQQVSICYCFFIHIQEFLYFSARLATTEVLLLE